MKRASRIFSTYYENPAKLEVVRKNPNLLIVTIKGFSKEDVLIYDAIQGWIDGLFSIIVNKPYSFDKKIKEEKKQFTGILYVKLS